MGGLGVRRLTYTNMTASQLAAFSETTGWSHSHVRSVSKPLPTCLFMHSTACIRGHKFPKFQRVVEQRHHILRGDGLSRIRPQKHRRALQSRFGSALLHIVAFHVFLFVSHAHTRLQLSYEAHSPPCFPMRTKFRASYVQISANTNSSSRVTS